MAATRLIAMHTNKGLTLAQSIAARTDYAKNPEKTEKGQLVTSYACDPMTCEEEFLLQKRLYEQVTGLTQRRDVIAYQIRQSFKPGEITPEEANRLGYELAMRFTKGKYSFIVATHTDRAHVHNHVVFNSTAIDGSRKFRDFRRSGKALQKLSDLICLENGYSVITPAPRKERKKRTTYPQRESIRDKVRRDIDSALEKAPEDLAALLLLLMQAGYEVKEGKAPALKGAGQQRFIRGGDRKHVCARGDFFCRESVELPPSFTFQMAIRKHRITAFPFCFMRLPTACPSLSYFFILTQSCRKIKMGSRQKQRDASGKGEPSDSRTQILLQMD